MRFIFSTFLILSLGFAIACQQTAGSSSTGQSADAERSDHADDAPRIELAEAKKAYDDGDTLFIDTRSEAAYKTEHIKGAVNIPAGEFETRYKEVPTDKKIIAYCS
ncbi:MAG: rhodanese-like domain-containing protein [Pyrinomonadaceae bacterium]